MNGLLVNGLHLVGAGLGFFLIDRAARTAALQQVFWPLVFALCAVAAAALFWVTEPAAMFEDLESGRHLYVDPDAVRRQYLERFEEHAETIRRVCRNLGIDEYLLATDRPLDLALFDLMHARMRRGRQVMRKRTSAARSRGGAP